MTTPHGKSAQHEGLTIVPAGAGAGKTHHIKETLADWVRRGLVRPERILAVTFTEAAASELRERIRSGLLAEGLVAEALAVERAYISTIHGLGLRLLTEHALAAGASPQPRHLGDAERDLLIRQALAHAKSLEPIKEDPERFGYSFQFGETVEGSLRTAVLSMIELLRSLGDCGNAPELADTALARLDEIYGPTLKDPGAAGSALLEAVTAMLASFPNGGVETVTANGPRETLEKNFELFRAVKLSPALLERDWQTWQSLRNLFVSNRNSKTPDGYDDAAAKIMMAAEALLEHPGPLADAKLHLRSLIVCAQEVMEAYEARKKALGLIDFADMITGAERLLRSKPEVRQAVLGEVDCVIIDEFQDTNPVQFALLWQIGRAAPRTLLVGDVKQSIMGFQGADPRLSAALASANPDVLKPLDSNWRSTPSVMRFVNAVGQGLFGSTYNALKPTRKDVNGPALEILHASRGRRVRNYAKPQEHIAERVSRILREGDPVTDRYSGAARPVRPSDIALLVCRHSTAASYAVELRARNIPVRIAEEGWATSNVVQVARAALAFAANPADIHAALMLRILGPAPLDPQSALTQQMDGCLMGDSVLIGLNAIADQIARLPVSVALDMVLDAAGVRAWADRQPDADQARADLLRLEAEAEAFEVAHRDLRAASGFHGDTAKVFLGWLDARTDERDFDRRPDPSAQSAEAVEIVTWHGSKGREWPITVVAEFDRDIEERPGTTTVRFENLELIDEMDAVFASARLVHTPDFAAPEMCQRFIEDRRPDFEANARNLLYVALTRARDRLVIEWPGFLKPRDAAAPAATCLFHVLEDACRPRLDGKKLWVGKVSCPATIVDLPSQAVCSKYAVGEGARSPRFGTVEPHPPMSLSPWRMRPSQLTGTSLAPASRAVVLGAAWPTSASDAVRGTALHLALRTYLIRPELAAALPAATGLDTQTLALVADRAAALRGWLADEGYGELRCEVPVLSHTPDGAEISGTIDLLAVGPAGCLLVDHKSGGSGEGLGQYWAQLSTYGALTRELFPQHPLRGLAIFWVDHGKVELVGSEE